MNRTDDLTTALRSLDAADPRVDGAGARARTVLQAILTTDPDQPTAAAPGGARTTARPPRTTRRVVATVGLVAAATAGIVALSPLTGGDHAFATWSATPSGMSSHEQAEAVAGCRASMQDAAPELAEGLAAAVAAVAERRGVWTTVVLSGADGLSALCVADSSAGLFEDAVIGSVGGPTGTLAPGARDLVATDLGTGTIGAGTVSLAAGEAGADVVGVVYRSATHGPVAATVRAGRFALWFPGADLTDAGSEGVDVQVTYRDGTTATRTLTL
ncbi:hypothetical protein [Cellulomonas oligotrophica]|uniref:Uncharacterized protein n=1 Tax=Cellulomonas oligotrophica TaxID=931536 RepID=A0A7Y9FEB9_9CELL|nr:hypothetical protein [Cellulomonas oligotrophica]NYD85588.1 hypothetical protein [Cellulomonas oligotrophica]GIG31403.1 hypothetical protein Col01nite_05620 [Cellulomonas oligotrophica]